MDDEIQEVPAKDAAKNEEEPRSGEKLNSTIVISDDSNLSTPEEKKTG